MRTPRHLRRARSALALAAAALLAAPAAALEIRIVDEAGGPIPEAVVAAAPLEGEEEAVEIPAPAGVAVLETPGRFLVTVRALGYLTWSGELAVPGGPLTVRMGPGSGLTGLVRDDEGGLMEGARLELRCSRQGVPPIYLATGPGGQYHVEGIPPGSWRLEARAEGHVGYWREGIELPPGRIERANVTLPKGSVLHLLVSAGDGMPVENAEIFTAPPARSGGAAREEGREEGVPVATDAWGRAVFGPLPRRETTRVGFRHPAHSAWSIEVVALTPEVSREVRLPQGGLLSVTVTDDQESPVAGASLALRPVQGRDADLAQPPPPAGPDGVLLVGPLPAGEYLLRVEAAGYRPFDMGRITFVDGMAKLVGIQLERP